MTISETVFEKSDEWSGFSIAQTADGYVVIYEAHNEGEVDSLKILVPYGTWGFDIGTDLNAEHPSYPSNGEAMAEMARSEATAPVEDRKVFVLDEGVLLPAAHQKIMLGLAPATAGAPKRHFLFSRRGMKWGRETPFSWFTFSLSKLDEVLYGEAHDMFTTMYLTHGLPHGMALWLTSNPATDENLFFVQMPKGLQVADDPFFEVFHPAACAKPSTVGLLLLVGHLEDLGQVQSAA